MQSSSSVGLERLKSSTQFPGHIRSVAVSICSKESKLTCFQTLWLTRSFQAAEPPEKDLRPPLRPWSISTRHVGDSKFPPRNFVENSFLLNSSVDKRTVLEDHLPVLVRRRPQNLLHLENLDTF